MTQDSQPSKNSTSDLTLNELFALDPLHMTEDNIAAICDRLRADRANFVISDRVAKASGKKVKAETLLGKPVKELSLSDLKL